MERIWLLGFVATFLFLLDGRLEAQATSSLATRPSLPSASQPTSLAPLGYETLGLPTFRQARCNSVAFSEDGRELISTGLLDSVVRFWNVETGKELRRLDVGSGVDSLFLVRNGKMVGVKSSNGLRFLEIPSGKFLFEKRGTLADSRRLTLSEDGYVVGVPASDGTWHLWDAATGHELLGYRPADENGRCSAMEISPSGEQLALLYERTIQVWNLTTGTVRAEIAMRQGVLWEQLHFLDEDRVIASGGETREGSDGPELAIESWSLNPPYRGKAFATHRRSYLAGVNSSLSRLRNRLYTLGPSSIEVWDCELGVLSHETRLPITFPKDRNGFGMVLSPDERKIAVRSTLHRLMLLDLENGRELWPTNEMHDGSVVSISTIPESTHLISSGEEGTTRLWDLETGKHLRVLHRFEESNRCSHLLLDSDRILVRADRPTVGPKSIPESIIEVVQISDGKRWERWDVPAQITSCLLLDRSEDLLAVARDPSRFEDFSRVYLLQKGEMPSPSPSEIPGNILSTSTSDKGQSIDLVTTAGQFRWDRRNRTISKASSLAKTTDFENATSIHRIRTDHAWVVGSLKLVANERVRLGDLRKIDPVSGRIHWERQFETGIPRALSVSLDGRLGAILFRSPTDQNRRENLEVWNVMTGMEIIKLPPVPDVVSCATFSNDGKSLLLGTLRGDILRWNLAEPQGELP